MQHVGIFQPTIFTQCARLKPFSRYIRAMHPRASVKSDDASLRKMLAAGWVAQRKVHGHRVQIHVSADPEQEVLLYNRLGNFHRKKLEPSIIGEIRRIFSPQEGVNVLDAEWLKPEGLIFVFDFLKSQSQLLNRMTFCERHELLPILYRSDCLQTLPVLKTFESCKAIIQSQDSHTEGLVFKSSTTRGFSDTSVLRCRKSILHIP